MKLLKNLALLFASISIISCGSDDDSSAPSFELTAEAIVGSYDMNALSIETERIVDNGNGTFTDIDVSLDEAIDFEDSTLILEGGNYSISGLYIKETFIDGDKDEDANSVTLTMDEGTYEFDSENLTITFESNDTMLFSGEYSITEVDENNLTIEQEAITSDNQIISTINSVISFERIVEEE